MSPHSIVWFRRDLRLEDNPALQCAVESGNPLIPLYIWCPEDEGDWAPGGASRYWLHESLQALHEALQQRGSRLILRAGAPLPVLQDLIDAFTVEAVYWNRLYEPAAIRRDTQLKKTLTAQGVAVQSFNSALLNEPMPIRTKQDKPFKVFTPFWKHCLTLEPPPRPSATVQAIPKPEVWPPSARLASFHLKPKHPWYQGIQGNWRIGEQAARARLADFLAGRIIHYPDTRDYPAAAGISSLSPHLHFGELGPRQIWHAVMDNERDRGYLTPRQPVLAYLRQLYWREFAHYLLFHFPQTSEAPLNEKFADFPWVSDAQKLAAWQAGKTGYPIVDAGMRELWQSGWMHNRVRMIVGSFLVKDLLLHWRAGADWFWDTLVDADLANNTLGWQWVAGCGADAAPFFRIFNPVLQGEKFDARGEYVRKWLPELAGLDNQHFHKPWELDAAELKKRGVRLGRDYPLPIVDHAAARKRALAALSALKEKN